MFSEGARLVSGPVKSRPRSRPRRRWRGHVVYATGSAQRSTGHRVRVVLVDVRRRLMAGRYTLTVRTRRGRRTTTHRASVSIA